MSISLSRSLALCGAFLLVCACGASDFPHADIWRACLDVPKDYAFTRETVRTATWDCGAFVVEAYRQANGPGTTQRVFLAVPKSAKVPLPAVVVPFYFPEAMLGFDPATGGTASQYCPRTNLTSYAGVTFVADLARRGYVAISADAYHLTYPRAQNPAEGFALWPRAGAALHGRYPDWTGIGKLVADTRLLVDFLVADARVDPARIGMMGHSLGGKMAFYAGLLDPRVKAVVASDFGLDWDRTNWDAVWYWGPLLPKVRAAGLQQTDLLRQANGKPFFLIAGKSDDCPQTRQVFADGSICPDRRRRRFVVNARSTHRPDARCVEAAYDFLDEFLLRTRR